MKDGGKGVLNAKGFYNYTEEEAKLWEETFTEFSYEIRGRASIEISGRCGEEKNGSNEE